MEVLRTFQPQSGRNYVDGTIGGGSHAEGILKASSPSGWIYGFDRDGEAIRAAQERLKPYEGRFEIRQANFSDMAKWVPEASCAGVLLDLGVSSHQLDTPRRGFSFQQDGPLDMRMDVLQPLTAAELVNDASEAELARIFWEFGDEPKARRLARALVMERRKQQFETTGELARCVERVVPRHGKKRHPATRVFMALRVAVNNEVSSLKCGLAAACTSLVQGGRLAVITFHSLEDRIVKQFGQDQSRPYSVRGPVDLPEFRQPCQPRFRWVHKKPVKPGQAEVAANPRARSAKLRVLEKIQD
jgi:16S rRNA (cytosine1402-N4)-methyltransferase